jgi:DNA-binding MarR family transcriptional regulator
MTAQLASVAMRRLLHRKVLAAYRHRAAVARKLGITEAELSALLHLSERAMTPGELGGRLQLTSGGMTALLHRLNRAGHIGRRPHPGDRRSIVVSAKPAILERIAELFAPLVADADELTGQLSARDRAVVHDYLDAIVASSERRADELVADREAADASPPDDAVHLWA